MHLKPLAITLAVSALALTPVLPVFDFHTGGAAYAEKGGNGGGNGGGKGGGNGGGKSEAKGNKGGQTAKAETVKTSKANTTKAKPVVAKASKVEGELAPNELGKMNGAMNANINAVLAHRRNGQTTNGPVGLLAGLAVADATAAAAADAVALVEAGADFDALDAGLEAGGFTSVEEYLQAKADGTLTEEQIAAIDPLVDAVGGTTEDGLALAETRPTEEEIAEAEAEAAAAEQAVADAEAAIGEAWNKDGDLGTLLTQLRERLAAEQEAIDAAIAETQEAEDLAELPAEDEVLPEEEVIVVVE